MSRNPQWMTEVFASNMAYRPKSKPAFAGDHRHDVRDAMHEWRVETISMWTGWIADKYLAAALMLGLSDDPIADSLQAFDDFNVWSLAPAHDLLAAHWRFSSMAGFLEPDTNRNDWSEPWFKMLPGRCSGMRQSTGGCIAAFRWWLKQRVEHDALRDPVMIRLVCLVLVQQHTQQGFEAEMDLYDALRARCALPTKTPS